MFTNMLSKQIQGKGDFCEDSWGKQKISKDYSLFHGLFTYDVPSAMWIVEQDDVEVPNALSTRATSYLGMLQVESGSGKCRVESKRHPRYQPNRGLQYASSILMPNPTADGIRKFGLITDDENGIYFKLIADGLYACLLNDGVETAHKIDIPWADFDLAKGNIYDIQAQWRGVGNVRFGIGNPRTGEVKEVYRFKLLGTLDKLSVRNPALSIGFYCENVTQSVVMQCGCVDVTAEGGGKEREQYGEASVAKTVSSGNPVIAIRNPKLAPNGKINTRDLKLSRIIIAADKKSTFKAYLTRDITSIVGGTWNPVSGNSFVEANTTMTSIDTTKMAQFATFTVQANIPVERTNPSPESIDFYLVRGDYLIIECSSGATANSDTTIEFGVEI
jgi:hypothetical protein